MTTRYRDLFHTLSEGFLLTDMRKDSKGAHVLTDDAIADRLDHAAGPENWTVDYTAAGDKTIVCHLTIHTADEFRLVKAGAGTAATFPSNDADSAHELAFRAAASRFGIRPRLIGAEPRREHAPATSAGTPAPSPVSTPEPLRNGRHPGGTEWAMNGAAGPAGGTVPAPSRPATIPRTGSSVSTGKQLFGKLKDMEKAEGEGIFAYITRWGKSQGYDGRMMDWDQAQAVDAWVEALRKREEVLSASA